MEHGTHLLGDFMPLFGDRLIKACFESMQVFLSLSSYIVASLCKSVLFWVTCSFRKAVVRHSMAIVNAQVSVYTKVSG